MRLQNMSARHDEYMRCEGEAWLNHLIRCTRTPARESTMRSPVAAGLTVRLTSLMALALKLCPQSSSLIAVTLRVEIPWMYI